MTADRSADLLAGRDISVLFGGIAALDGVTLELRVGERLGLIGPNGAGKTTLVNVLTGFQPAARGRVLLGAAELGRLPPRAIARRGVARTFQGARLFRHLTVLENVEVALCARGASRRAARRRAAEIVAWIGMPHRGEQRADSLPFGEERLVGIARALALEPRFLLLDEPAAGLNEMECDELIQLMTRLPAELGCGVLLIEHNMHVVTAACERLQVLDGGRTLAIGPTAAVARDPAVIHAYLGTAEGAGLA